MQIMTIGSGVVVVVKRYVNVEMVMVGTVVAALERWW